MPTGSLHKPAYGLTTATLLPNGKVLINQVDEPEGELYDPGTGMFEKTRPRTPQTYGSAALLMNGKVLLAGGNDDPGESALAELYDPSTDTFTRTGNLTVPRADDPATRLSDGTALIAGNNGFFGITLASAELYDPTTGIFTRTGDMTADRGLHTATLLNNGRVLIAGGIHKAGTTWPALSSTELYTPFGLLPPPTLLSLSGDGRGQAAILHAGTSEIASASNPATAGDMLEIYCAGLTNASIIPPRIAIGGRMAETLWFGNAPGFADLNQINVRVPEGIPPGPTVSVRLTYLDRHSNEVTMGVK